MEPTADARTRILDAAERAFAHKGLAGARVAAIAEEAGVNKATLYYYFESKEALHDAVVERVFGEMLPHAARVAEAEHESPAEALMAFMEGYGRVLGEHPDFVRIVLRSLLDQPGEVPEFAVSRLSRVVPPLIAQVQRAQASGHINPALSPHLMPPALVAPVVFLALAGPMLSSILGHDLAALREQWLLHVRELLMNGLVPRPPEVP